MYELKESTGHYYAAFFCVKMEGKKEEDSVKAADESVDDKARKRGERNNMLLHRVRDVVRSKQQTE